jgi:hypothetical protein
MKTLRATAAEDLLDIFLRRHERLPAVITTNRPTQDWGHFLSDVPAATAILDRFLQHVEIILMQGRSYRRKGRDHAAPAPDHPSAGGAEVGTDQAEPLRSPGSEPAASPRPRRKPRARARGR